MYHFYKAYGDTTYEASHLQECMSEANSVTTKISTIVTLSPSFFRSELEIGMNALGLEDGDRPSFTERFALDVLVINPLLDLLYEYAARDQIGAHLAATEMEKVLIKYGPLDDFPQRQCELIEEAVREAAVREAFGVDTE